MQAVSDIFKAFGGPTALAKATGLPVQTVFDWQTGKPAIPPWRRMAVLEAARREQKELPDHCIVYLSSNDRTARSTDEAA